MVKFPEHRRALWQIVLLMFVGTLFWVLAQQGGSTISLFIDRFVNRQAFNIEVPTALFQSVNAIAVMLAGVVLAWLASPESRGNSTLRVWLKFAFGLLLMACGFMLLAFDARHAAADGQASMGVMISGGDCANHASENVWRINRDLYAGNRRGRQLAGRRRGTADDRVAN